jgi:E3 ubiquitin-protein ligase RGLG
MPPQQPHKRLDRKYSRIADNYQTLDQVGWIINLFNYS